MPFSLSRIHTFLAPLLLCAIAPLARADSLDARLNALLADPNLKSAQIGIDIQELTPKGPALLFSHNPTLPLEPASNTKLLTTAAAFERYGPAATFKTNLFAVGPDLLLVGGGDPGLGDSKIAAANGQTPTAVFEQWAQTLKQAGITQYRQLVIDDRIFDAQWINPDWPANQLLSDDFAPIAGLNFNANCLDWIPKLTPRGIDVDLIPETSYVSVAIKASRGKESRVSMVRPATVNHFELRGTLAASATAPYSVPIYDPGLWTGSVLHDILARAGIPSTDSTPVRRANADENFPSSQGPNAAHLLASHETPILAVLKRANTNSLNMMAEGLCKRLGYDTSGKPGSWQNGTAAIEDFAASLGVSNISLDDGSGLSHKDRAPARAFTAVLAHILERPDADLFISTMALPGQDGTLIHRFKHRSVADHIHAKTGHIDGVSTLSGIITVNENSATSRRFVFSILVNKQGGVNDWQDDICQTIYQWALGK